MTGTAPITINPEGSQVAMNYWIQVTSDLTGNENVTIQGVTVDGAALNIVPETAGTCSDKSITTQAECNGDKSWTADPHIGMYAGTINLPATGAMTATDAVKAIVTVEWKDLNTEAANIIDTETGTKASSETTNNLTVNVIVEQKVN